LKAVSRIGKFFYLIFKSAPPFYNYKKGWTKTDERNNLMIVDGKPEEEEGTTVCRSWFIGNIRASYKM